MAKTSDAQMAASARYDAANTVQVHLKLNRTTDADILDRLQTAAAREGGKQGYIKELIRADIDK